MATSKALSRRERVRFADRHSIPSDRKVDLIMQRLPEEVVLTGRGQPDRRVKVDDLNAREFGKLVRQVIAEMLTEPGLEY